MVPHLNEVPAIKKEIDVISLSNTSNTPHSQSQFNRVDLIT